MNGNSSQITISFDFGDSKSKDCRVAKGFEDAGKQGQYLGFIFVRGRRWAIVVMDGSDEPELWKADSIEISQPSWTLASKLQVGK